MSNWQHNSLSMVAKEDEFRCTLCSYKTDNWHRIERHSELLHQSKDKKLLFCCDDCDYISDCQRNLNRHIRIIHKSIRKYECNKCGHKTVDRWHLNKHMIHCHGERIQAFIQQAKIEAVPSKIEADKPKIKAIETSKLLDRKVRERNVITDSNDPRRNNKKGKTCEECGFRANRRYEMIRHAKNVHKKYIKIPCIYCDHEADNWNELKAHNRTIHIDLYRFYCDKCDFRGIAKGDLDKHVQLVHDKIKKYKCDECEYKTTSKVLLQRHHNRNH